MSIWNFTRWLKLGDQAPKNPLYLYTALSLYKKGAGQRQEIFLKAFIKIYFWEKLSVLNACFKWSATSWVNIGFSFLLLHTNEATLCDYCPQHGIRKFLRDVLPIKLVLCKRVLCWVKLTQRFTKCQESCFLGKKPCAQIASARKTCCLGVYKCIICYTDGEIIWLLVDQKQESNLETGNLSLVLLCHTALKLALLNVIRSLPWISRAN